MNKAQEKGKGEKHFLFVPPLLRQSLLSALLSGHVLDQWIGIENDQ